MPTTALLKKLLHSIPLGRKADPALRVAVAGDDLSGFQEAFLAAIAKPVKRLRKQLKRSSLLAAWSCDAVDLTGRERELAASLEDVASHTDQRLRTKGKNKRKKRRRSPAESKYDEVIVNWLVEVGAAPGPWETIAVAEILLREGHALSPENFTQALSVIADAALRESSGGLFDSPTATEEDNAIRQLIRQGESPWICSLLLSPLGGVQTLTRSATESLRKILLECVDADGLVHGSLLNRLPEWLAPFTRCSIWANVFQEPLWRGESAERLTLVTERSSLLTFPILHHTTDDSPSGISPSLTDILEHLIPLSGSTHEKRLSRLVKQCRLPVGAVSRPPKKKKPKTSDDPETVEPATANSTTSKSSRKTKPPKKDANLKTIDKKPKQEVSWQSDASCMAILRSSADADADTLTLEWHSSNVQIMVAAAGVPIFAGNWSWSVQLDDEVLPSPTAWKCSCWVLEPETGFVELEAEGGSDVKQVRQLLLAPYDRFAMMTNSVTSSDPKRKVQLVTSVPLVNDVACSTCDVTRELELSIGPRTVRSFPLWLEDDRIQHTLGSFRQQDGQLELAGVGKGGVTLPVALDWHPKRTYLPADWNRLTVTENRRTVGGHEASGFRIRIGDHQVQLYRSLMKPTISRAVLGLHTWDESVYGRVPAKGGLLQPLVEVEYPE
ncbi:MAG: hypothetical protein O2856_00745 [Planctomycetota bacterium]|nr:hypothetical protein [Planctomycetota bacterium]